MTQPEPRYHIGIDFGIEGGDMTCFTIRRGDEVRIVPKEDYEIVGNTFTLKKSVDSYFEKYKCPAQHAEGFKIDCHYCNKRTHDLDISPMAPTRCRRCNKSGSALHEAPCRPTRP